MATLHDGAGDFRVALHGHGAAKEGAGRVVLVQQVEDAPDADATAVLEERLVEEVALAGGNGRRHLVVGLVAVIAIQ